MNQNVQKLFFYSPPLVLDFWQCTGRTVRECGLVVNPTLPWLGASPDGLICDPLESTLDILEIKCPYSYHLCTVQEAAAGHNFFASVVDGAVIVKRSNKYYHQVQGQMALAGVLWCDFMIYTFKNHTIKRIRFDSDFWDSMQTRLTKFFSTLAYHPLVCFTSCSSTSVRKEYVPILYTERPLRIGQQISKLIQPMRHGERQNSLKGVHQS